MEITPIAVVGAGVLHDCVTRDGQHFRILVPRSGGRKIFVDDPSDPDVTVGTVVLGQDEADQLAELLHSRSAADRLAELGGRW